MASFMFSKSKKIFTFLQNQFSLQIFFEYFEYNIYILMSLNDVLGTQMRESCATQGGSPRPRPATGDGHPIETLGDP